MSISATAAVRLEEYLLRGDPTPEWVSDEGATRIRCALRELALAELPVVRGTAPESGPFRKGLRMVLGILPLALSEAEAARVLHSVAVPGNIHVDDFVRACVPVRNETPREKVRAAVDGIRAGRSHVAVSAETGVRRETVRQIDHWFGITQARLDRTLDAAIALVGDHVFDARVFAERHGLSLAEAVKVQEHAEAVLEELK